MTPSTSTVNKSKRRLPIWAVIFWLLVWQIAAWWVAEPILLVSPLSEHCDRVLVAKSDMVSIVDSLVAPLSLVNALIVALSAGREEVLRGNFDKLENIWQTYHIYEKKDEYL